MPDMSFLRDGGERRAQATWLAVVGYLRRRLRAKGRLARVTKKKKPSKVLDPRFTAAIEVVRRTGATTIQVRYSDDEQPVIWFAVAGHNVGPEGVPIAAGGRRAWTTAAALTPERAVFKLAEELVDGAQCAYCHRPSGFLADPGERTFASSLLCWWTWDQETGKYVQECRL